MCECCLGSHLRHTARVMIQYGRSSSLFVDSTGVFATMSMRSQISRIKTIAALGSIELTISNTDSMTSSIITSNALSEFLRSHCLARGIMRGRRMEQIHVAAVRSMTCAKRAHDDGSNATGPMCECGGATRICIWAGRYALTCAGLLFAGYPAVPGPRLVRR